MLVDGIKSRKKTPHQWFELQDTCAYHEVFDKKKLFWIELVEEGRFAYDEYGMYGEATTFIMTGESLKYLCALLNTKLIRWFLWQIAPTSGTGTFRWKKVYVETIPLPKITEAEQKPFIHLANEIIKAKDEPPRESQESVDNTASLEAKIDNFVCELYGLTEEETILING